jgi:nicotinate phosphoribosyltransferase
VSGGLDEDKIIALGDSVDGGFGVGTAISAAATIDYSMDIVEIEGEAIAKRGKASGAKHFLRCRDCGWESVIPIDRPYGDCEECGGVMEQMLAPVIEEGKILAPLPGPEKIRDLVLRQLPSLRLVGPE